MCPSVLCGVPLSVLSTLDAGDIGAPGGKNMQMHVFSISQSLNIIEVHFFPCSHRCCQRKIIHFNGSQIISPL